MGIRPHLRVELPHNLVKSAMFAAADTAAAPFRGSRRSRVSPDSPWRHFDERIRLLCVHQSTTAEAGMVRPSWFQDPRRAAALLAVCPACHRLAGLRISTAEVVIVGIDYVHSILAKEAEMMGMVFYRNALFLIVWLVLMSGLPSAARADNILGTA